MLYWGIFVIYEAIRYWCQKFGQAYGHQIRRARPKPGDKWHLDEVVITIKGKQYYLWRAVDQAGNVLDISWSLTSLKAIQTTSSSYV